MRFATRFKAAWRAFGGRTRSDYKAGEVNRLLADWVRNGGSADDMLRGSLVRVRERARDLDRNSPLCRQFLRMAHINVLGPHGIRCQPQVRSATGDLDRAANAKIAEAWQAWCWNVSVDGRLTWHAFQRLVMRSMIRDGEALVRIWRSDPDNPFGLSLEAIDVALLDESLNRVASSTQNEIRLGVEVDGRSRPVAYHVWNRPERLASGTPRERERIPADQILHLYDPETAGQTRGISWLASVLVPLKMLEGYREAEVVAARISAAKMGFFERKEGDYANATITDEERNNLEIDASPGSFLVLPDGYTATSWAADHPSTAFAAFVKDGTRAIAVGVGVSYNGLNSDLEAVSYSALKNGLAQERDMWRMLAQAWIASLCVPVYREFIASAMLNGTIGTGRGLRLDGYDATQYDAARWSPRGWPPLEPQKETTATIDQIRAGLTSRTKWLAEQGVDLEDVLEDLQAEKELAEQYGVDISGPGPLGTGSPPKPVEDDEDGEDERIVVANGNGRRF